MTERGADAEAGPAPDPFDDRRVDSLRRSFVKTAGMIAVFSTFALLIHYTPLRELLDDLDALRSLLADTGLLAPALFSLMTAAMVFVGAPRLPFSVLGGMLFGFWLGSSLSLVATLAGAYGPYLFARYGSAEWVSRRLGHSERAAAYLRQPTILNVFLIRQIPIWGVFTNLLLGSLRVSQRSFVVGSLLGFLPQTVIFTLFGSGLVEESLMRALSRIWIAIPLLGVTAFAISRWIASDRSGSDQTGSDRTSAP